jgi:hypothetical protein
MATLQIDIPDQQAAALKAYALVRGLTVEQCVVQLVEQAAPLAERSAPFEQELARDPKRPIWEVIAERMQALPPEVLERLPEDGASQPLASSAIYRHYR